MEWVFVCILEVLVGLGFILCVVPFAFGFFVVVYFGGYLGLIFCLFIFVWFGFFGDFGVLFGLGFFVWFSCCVCGFGCCCCFFF